MAKEHRTAEPIDLDRVNLPDMVRLLLDVATTRQARTIIQHNQEVARVVPLPQAKRPIKEIDRQGVERRAKSPHQSVVDRTAGSLKRFGPQGLPSIDEETAAAELAIAEEAIQRQG
jgi:hypothetical protein